MIMHAGIHDGRYFIFLLNSSEHNPIHVQFRDRAIKLKHSHPEYRWREKYYLYPAILQKKWYDYKINDRYIPSIKFDTNLPLLLDYPLSIEKHQKPILSIISDDTHYRKLEIFLVNRDGNIVYQKLIKSLWKNEKKDLEICNLNTGIYKIFIRYNGESFFKGNIIYVDESKLPKMSFKDLKKTIDEISGDSKKITNKIKIYCTRCKSEVVPIKSNPLTEYQYLNYIPFKEYVDFERLNEERVKEYLIKIRNPGKHKSGLIHLLNIIRMASLDDELKIIRSIFKDDPPFGYFITEKLFFFELIPLMKDRDLQSILTRIDDDTISSSLKGVRQEIRNKIFRNISRRRIKYIQGKNRAPQVRETETSRQFINNEIRNHCLKLYGRLIKIPSNIINSFRISWDEDSLNRINKIHGHELLILFDGNPISLKEERNNSECKSYYIEYSNEAPITITGITETSVLLRVKVPLKYMYLHLYYWVTNLEDFKFYENIPRETVIPLNYTSSLIIITVGGIDLNNRPMEQVIRIKIK